MSIERHWLDWSQPCLPQAAAWLVDRATQPRDTTLPSATTIHSSALTAVSTLQGICDLGGVVCVLPGQRAGRVLLELLLGQCEARDLRLHPPRTMTPGALLTSLTMDQPIASDLEIEMAWMQALRSCGDDEPESIKPFLPHRPDAGEFLAWHELARTVARLHRELAGHQVTFAQVAEKAERFEMLSEGERWRALQLVHERYRAALRSNQLVDPHEAQHRAIASRLRIGQAESPREIILIGVTELNGMQRALLHAMEGIVTALVHAPESLDERFDELGCVVPAAWAQANIDLDDRRIVMADRPEDQAQRALRAIGELDGARSASQITIGLGDAALAPAMEHAAEWAGLAVRDAAGRSLRRTPPCLALAAVAEYLADPRFATFAALLRHADIERWLWSQLRQDKLGVSDWLTLLDKYFSDHLHERFSGEWLGDSQARHKLAAVHDAVQRLLAPLSSRQGAAARRPLAQWAQPALDVLAELYRDAETSPQEPGNALRLESCERICTVLAEFAGAASSLQPKATAAEAIELLLEYAAAESLPERADSSRIEMLGWLELHLDVAPVLIITGFNEGSIPTSATSDAFLPDSLRSALGLPCNAMRYARDAYLLEAIRNSRPEVTLIAGRRNARGEPLAPSRLLLACGGEALARRVLQLCDDRVQPVRPAAIGLSNLALARSRFVVPPLPEPLPQRMAMSVTDFRAFLACPYRFALARLLKLESLDDSATELDALQFGNLAHEALCAFGVNADLNASDKPEKIERFLLHELERRAADRFGKSPAPSVRVQIARMQQRFVAFSKAQAEQAAAGWRIRFCELAFGRMKHGSEGAEEIALDVPGQAPMPLRGKIDRIDFNERTGEWRIIDYKTGEMAHSPHKAHHESEQCDDPLEWIDLQLPLYHYLATRAPLGIATGATVRLAYFCLPRQPEGAELKQAQWSPAQLAGAIELARQVVRDIRAGSFAINRDFDARIDDFARICQTTTFTEDDVGEAEE